MSARIFSKSYDCVRSECGSTASDLFGKLEYFFKKLGDGFTMADDYLAKVLSLTRRQVRYAKQKLKKAGRVIYIVVRNGASYITKYLIINTEIIQTESATHRTKLSCETQIPQDKIVQVKEVDVKETYETDVLATQSQARESVNIESRERLESTTYMRRLKMNDGCIANLCRGKSPEFIKGKIYDLKEILKAYKQKGKQVFNPGSLLKRLIEDKISPQNQEKSIKNVNAKPVVESSNAYMNLDAAEINELVREQMRKIGSITQDMYDAFVVKCRARAI